MPHALTLQIQTVQPGFKLPWAGIPQKYGLTTVHIGGHGKNKIVAGIGYFRKIHDLYFQSGFHFTDPLGQFQRSFAAPASCCNENL